jgi:hypothetical protein
MRNVHVITKPLKKDRVNPPCPDFEKALYEERKREDYNIPLVGKDYTEDEIIQEHNPHYSEDICVPMHKPSARRVTSKVDVRRKAAPILFNTARTLGLDVEEILGYDLYTMAVHHYDSKYTITEMAEMYGCSTQTVRNKLYGSKGSVYSYLRYHIVTYKKGE